MSGLCATPGKRVYARKRDAKVAMRRLRRGRRTRLHAYRCRACGGWHLGHRPPWMSTEQPDTGTEWA